MHPSMLRPIQASALYAALCLGSLVLSASAPAADPRPAAERLAALRSSFAFQPAPSADPAPAAAPDEAVVLEALTITESISRRDLAQSIQSRWAREAADKFSWAQGGLLFSRPFGRLNADLGLWTELGDRLTGLHASRELFLKVDVVRVRW